MNAKVKLQPVLLGASLVFLTVGLLLPDQAIAMYRGLQSPLGTQTPVINLGEIEVGKTSERVIPLFNSHFSSVSIRDIKASCGCTSASSSVQTVPPFRSGALKLLITPSSPGRGGEFVTLDTNHGTQRISLSFDGVSEKTQK